ncbi:MAG: alpha-1,4-glucan--maltose-1-phosphate maltosyltransferase [Coleofasciculus sp. G1-WW12-02]|uniref:alpha-1,4-glucan--maltose-1-phosphate maltosyltransferase n=1 Tax=Coleofasciculus sp. G1-WW12-02 TaxID=3068483 RepID=UPI0032FEB928
MLPLPEEGRRRVQIEGVWPEIDGGRFAIKRTVGERVYVEVDMFCDSHDAVSGVILYRPQKSQTWFEVPLSPTINDRWQGEFTVSEIGDYVYTIMGWADHFKSWQRDMTKKLAAEQDLSVDLLIGANLVEDAVKRASGDDAAQLKTWVATLRSQDIATPILGDKAISPELAQLMAKYPDRKFASTYHKQLKIIVDRERARFSTWYEIFPRSCGEPGKHGTFKDAQARLPYIASMGFDVLYLPPIHPIGKAFRKGKNNTTVAESDDVGVPWGIGAAEGGHKAVHPQLGTMADFEEFVAQAAEHGLEIALDIAFQCSPDHPYVKENPQWFRSRPDGTIQYAENPPKKYQDIYPIDFETADWQNLWEELRSVIQFWIEKGVRIFRVDNPHTKAFDFWEWVIADLRQTHPDLIFLSESFTRPKVMYRLAKLGFTQSYTYFTWRNSKWEMTQYLTELTQTPAYDIFRPNFWPNTPDILHEFIQHGGRPACIIRLVLAATLAANYGIYGPAFEVCENRALKPGSEEYLNSEKYQIREWDLDSPYSIKDLIARVNRARREHPALQSNKSLRFHHTDNNQIICYSKQTDDFKDVMLMMVSFDPQWMQAGFIDLPLESLGIDPYREYHLHDLLSDTHYTWFGGHNYVELNPQAIPAHVFWVRQ